MNQEKLKNKAVYLLSIMTMCVILVAASYFFFLKTYDIDLTADIRITYTGENGNATAKVSAVYDALNQRVAEFMDTVYFVVKPNENLANGDTITIKAGYDHELASLYHYKAVGTTKKIIVEGLYNRYGSLDQIDQEYLEAMNAQSAGWLQEKSGSIFNSVFKMKPAGRLSLDQKLIYSAFLKSQSAENDDKMVYVYELTFTRGKESWTVDYLVCVPSVNDSKTVVPGLIYGEKAYLNGEEEKSQDGKAYIGRVYGSKYKIETLYDSKKESEKAKPEDSDQTSEEETEIPS